VSEEQHIEQGSGGRTDGDAPPLRVVLADDHAIVRQGVKSLVDGAPDMQVVGEAESGNQVRLLIDDLTKRGAAPDVVVMDVSMPDGDGKEATARIRRRWPAVKVLALSMHEDHSYVRSLLQSGAVGYMLKRSSAEELIRAIRIIAEGGTYIDPAWIRR
jgi:DNA-binding NarL/FixJ family response regulator